MKNLLIMIHNHQPIGNFNDVIRKAFENSYIPFLEKLLKFKNINIALHNSGIIYEFMEEENIKDYEDLIKELLKENRLELVSGTFYEAVLSLIPEKDKINQINLMNDYLKNKFNYTPKGFWLTERIWEPDLPKYIKKANLEYTLIDDYAFKKIGFNEKDLFNYYITENEGFSLKIFPILKKLRYMIPFKEIDEVFNYIKNSDESSIIFTYGDDGEKFGLWPNTYDHVYKNGYLERFLERLNSDESIKTSKFCEIIENLPPKKRIYLPLSSYEEMAEWSNNNFRNYLTKYEESNKLHKRMLLFREKIEDEKKEEYKYLLKSQCNDGYWHGIFGGLYLPHLRDALYENILKGESFIVKRPNIEIKDFDKDGIDEIILYGKFFNLFIHKKGGKVVEIDKTLDFVNLSNVISRYKESYHEKIIKGLKLKDSNEEIQTIHEKFNLKENNLEKYLYFDNYCKENFLIHFINNLDELKESLPIVNLFQYEIIDINSVRLFNDYFEIKYEVDDKIFYQFAFPKVKEFLVIEFNLKIDENSDSIEKEVINFFIKNKPMYIKTNNLYNIITDKIFTVSSSESGIEKIYQGLTIYFLYKNNDINIINVELGEKR